MTRSSPSALYACPFNLFDVTSGASLSMRTLLAGLARRGSRVVALQAMVFDSAEGGERVLSVAARHPDRKFFESEVDGVRHLILRTASTTRGAMTSSEEQVFFGRVRRELAENRPDFLILWGGMVLERAIVAAARKAGVPVVLYLVNPQYRSNDAFEDVSLIVTDTEATARLYRERNGVDPVPVGKFIDPVPVRAVRRKPQVFTFVNPAPPKGPSLFMALATLARRELPEARFLVVEGRGKWKPALQALGYSVADFPNVEVLPTQRDMRPVYARTRALLLPSFWHESGARVIPEALLNAIPVLATDTGGSAELLGDGGFVFALPEALREHPGRRVPESVAVPWLQTISRLWRDETFYAESCRRAERAAAAHSLERSVDRFLAAVDPLLRRDPGA